MKYLPKVVLLLCAIFILSNCGDDEMPEETRPILSIGDIEVIEADVDHTATFKVTLSGSNTTNVTVSYSTLDGTAVSGSDYTSEEGDIIFGPGVTEQTIEIPIKGDEIEESNETFEIILLNPINALLGRTKAVATILNDDDQINNELEIPTTGYTTPLSYDGYQLVWSDEFQSGILDDDCWSHDLGNGSNGWGNSEIEFYQINNVIFAEQDYLVIEAREENQGGFNHTSSRIKTQGKKEFQYGRIDIRAALPKGQGIWPAIWMLGSNFSTVGWPACGEIDIMELVGHQPSTVHSTVHFGSNFANHQFIGEGTSLTGGQTFNDEFHVFSINWEENLIQFLVDDVVHYEITPSNMNGQPYPFNAPFFFILNVAVGGQWPGNPDASTTFPQHMIVDYIRVFQQ